MYLSHIYIFTADGCHLDLLSTPGMLGLAPEWVRLAPNGTNLFWKSPGLSHLGTIWPTLETNLPSLIYSVVVHRDDRFGPTLVRLAPNGEKNPGLFKIRFQNILAHWAYLNMSLIFTIKCQSDPRWAQIWNAWWFNLRKLSKLAPNSPNFKHVWDIWHQLLISDPIFTH